MSSEGDFSTNPDDPEKVKKQEEKSKSRTAQLLLDLKIEERMPDFLDPRLPSGAFSHSQYDLYKQCGRAYAYRYLERVPRVPGAAIARGVALHAGVEHVLRAKMLHVPLPGIEEVRQVVSDRFEAEAKDVVWDDDLPQHAVKGIVMRALETYLVHAVPKLNPVAVEKGFAVKWGSVPIVGWIDLIDEVPFIDLPPGVEDGVVPMKRVVVDMKTTNKTWGQSKVDIHPQLTLYAAVEGVPDVRIDQLVLLKRGPVYDPVASTRTARDVEVLREDLEETTGLIRGGIFPKCALDHWRCGEKYCEYWALCRGKTCDF